MCDYASRRRRAQRQGVALEQPHAGAVGLVDRTETECASGPPLGLNSLRSGLHLSCVEAADLPTRTSDHSPCSIWAHSASDNAVNPEMSASIARVIGSLFVSYGSSVETADMCSRTMSGTNEALVAARFCSFVRARVDLDLDLASPATTQPALIATL